MNNIQESLSQLKSKLESTAFLVSKGESEKVAHAMIVQSLVIVSELETSLSVKSSIESKTNSNLDEINKVSRRLKLWAKRPNQENSKILNAYIKLKRLGKNSITENELKKELSEDSPFESNFAQMKIIAEKNHGKVFEQYGNYVEIWKPVASQVDEYEKVVFGGVEK